MDMAGDREVCQTIELDHDSVDGSRSPFKSVNSKLGLAPLCSPAAVLRWYVLPSVRAEYGRRAVLRWLFEE